MGRECQRYFGDSIDITDVFQDYESLVEFLISSYICPPIDSCLTGSSWQQQQQRQQHYHISKVWGTHSCHSEWRAADVQVAGGCNCTMHVGWKPDGSFESRPPDRSSSAEWPRQTNESPSPTMLIVATLMLGSRSSRSNWWTITCPADPATSSVSDTTQRQSFWIPSRGSSVNGSYIPTYIIHISRNQFNGYFIRSQGDHSAVVINFPSFPGISHRDINIY